MTEKQKIQKERAWFKYQISGIKFLISQESLTRLEQIQLDIIKRDLALLKKGFDENSMQLGLKVPQHKCYCGKEGKYQFLDEWFCSNHIKFE
jgi:hypothetical protein